MNSVSIIVLSTVMLAERAWVLMTSYLNLFPCPRGVEEGRRVGLGSPQSALGEGAVASSGAKPSDKLLIFNTGFYE